MQTDAAGGSVFGVTSSMYVYKRGSIIDGSVTLVSEISTSSLTTATTTTTVLSIEMWLMLD